MIHKINIPLRHENDCSEPYMKDEEHQIIEKKALLHGLEFAYWDQTEDPVNLNLTHDRLMILIKALEHDLPKPWEKEK